MARCKPKCGALSPEADELSTGAGLVACSGQAHRIWLWLPRSGREATGLEVVATRRAVGSWWGGVRPCFPNVGAMMGNARDRGQWRGTAHPWGTARLVRTHAVGWRFCFRVMFRTRGLRWHTWLRRMSGTRSPWRGRRCRRWRMCSGGRARV